MTAYNKFNLTEISREKTFLAVGFFPLTHTMWSQPGVCHFLSSSVGPKTGKTLDKAESMLDQVSGCLQTIEVIFRVSSMQFSNFYTFKPFYTLSK